MQPPHQFAGARDPSAQPIQQQFSPAQQQPAQPPQQFPSSQQQSVQPQQQFQPIQPAQGTQWSTQPQEQPIRQQFSPAQRAQQPAGMPAQQPVQSGAAPAVLAQQPSQYSQQLTGTPGQMSPQQQPQQSMALQQAGSRIPTTQEQVSPPVSAQQGQAPAQQATQKSGQMQPGIGREAAHEQQFAPAQQRPATSPYVDIYDSADHLTILADLPGCEPENVQLQASNNTLRISGDRQKDMLENDERPLQRERLERIERTVSLPVEIELDEAEASCENGVCKIILPKSEREQQKHIGVQ